MNTPMTLFFETGGYTLTSNFCKEWLEKEKQFAFECYKEGADRAMNPNPFTIKENFEQFYSQTISDGKN